MKRSSFHRGDDAECACSFGGDILNACDHLIGSHAGIGMFHANLRFLHTLDKSRMTKGRLSHVPPPPPLDQLGDCKMETVVYTTD